MAFTTTQLDAIKAAIASGELTVEFMGPGGPMRVTYRSMAELIAAKNMIEAELGAAGTITLAPRVSFASHTKA